MDDDMPIGELECPACHKKAKDHSGKEHRRCAVLLLQELGIVPQGISADQVEIVTSDDMERPSDEIMSMITGRARKAKPSRAPEDDVKEMLQNILESRFPVRPNSEDFWVMNQITADLDTKEQEITDPEEFYAYLARHTDKDAALYVGLTRANEALVEGIKSMKHATHLLALLHAVWMDGFAVGQELHKVHDQ